MTLTVQGLGYTDDTRPHQPKIRSVIKLLDVGKSSVSIRRELMKSLAVVDQRARTVYLTLSEIAACGRGGWGDIAFLLRNMNAGLGAATF